MSQTTSMMDRIKWLHQQAMELCDRAIDSRNQGNHDEALTLFRQSFEAEGEAASLVSASIDFEPTRSVLHRSAAALALDCSEFRAAERLIAAALIGNPPDEIAEELRDLLEQVNFGRHLELRGLQLAPNEFQLSISGKKVGLGIARSEEFVDRVQATEKMILRTFERRSGHPFREAGRAIKEISKNCEVYLSLPRAGSFSATMRVGLPERQLILPGIDTHTIEDPAEIIEEIAKCLDAFNQNDGERLVELITDPAYHRNFIALAERLLPDGENVSQVGFTVTGGGVQRNIALRRIVTNIKPKELVRRNGWVTVEGRLLFADATKASRNKIRVVDDDGVAHVFIVPEGIMADIVKPLWEDRVAITGIRENNQTIRLERITKANEPLPVSSQLE